MFEIADTDRLTIARTLLSQQIGAAPAQQVTRFLTTPYGVIPDANLHWRPADGLWAYLDSSPNDSGVWGCWYGTNPGNEDALLVPSIEINIPTVFEDKSLSGRVLMDSEQNLYLGHKGLLGGGRGGQVKMAVFEALIRGFEKEYVAWPNGQNEKVYVIGRIDADDFVVRLNAFVAETERLRSLARAGTLDSAVKSTHPIYKKRTSGKTRGRRSSEYEIELYEARVVEALRIELAERGLTAKNSRHQGVDPDLYTLNAENSFRILFEVKSRSNTQSWYTAIGQLVYYSAAQLVPPRRVLVCPARLQHPNFKAAFLTLGISLVIFRDEGDDRFTFDGLEDVLMAT